MRLHNHVLNSAAMALGFGAMYNPRWAWRLPFAVDGW